MSLEKLEPRPPVARLERWLPLFLGLFLFAVYCLTSSKLAFGYEGKHRAEAEAWVTGTEYRSYVAGFLEVVLYLPSAWAKKTFEPTGRLVSIQNILFIWVHPFIGALIGVAFFGFVREVLERTRPALVATLLMAFGTMMFPYAKYGMEDHQTLWTLVAVWMLVRYVREPSMLAAMVFAMAMGLLALTKVTGLVHCCALFLTGCWFVWRRGIYCLPEFKKHAGAAFAIGAAALAVFFLTNQWRFGGWLFEGRYNPATELSSQYFLQSLFGVLFGVGKSLIVFSPPILLGLWYFRRFLAKVPEMLPIYVAFGVVTIWYLAFSNHFNDETWGPRRLHFLLPLLMLPVGCWADRFLRQTRVVQLLGAAVIAAGLLVQGLAICFDYTIHAFVLSKHPIYSIENVIWQPKMNAIWFDAHLLQSWGNRRFGGESIPYVISQHYVPWDGPEEWPDPLVFDVSKYDQHLDFWWVQEQVFWSPGPYWFRQASSFVAVFFLILGVAAGGLAIRGLPRWETGGPREE